MILGLNTDVRHRGKTFHIQTEDSGLSNPVLITHLFIGGTIITTKKQSYETLVVDGSADEEKVRERMRRQHKAMYEELMAGEHDEAAKRPQRSSRFKDIPLARRTGNVGLISSAPPKPARPSPSPPPVPPEATAKPSEDEASLIESVDLILLDDDEVEPIDEARPEYPSTLSAGRPFDGLLVAHLLDDRG